MTNFIDLSSDLRIWILWRIRLHIDFGIHVPFSNLTYPTIENVYQRDNPSHCASYTLRMASRIHFCYSLIGMLIKIGGIINGKGQCRDKCTECPGSPR